MEPAEPEIGLCATCRFHRIVAGARSNFHMCERSFSDPRFLKYPPLPVVRCVGYRASEPPQPDLEKTL